MMYVKASENRRKNILLRLMIILLIFMLVFVLVDSVVEELIREKAISICRNRASVILNDSVLGVLESDGGGYQDFVEIISDENSDVRYISSDAAKINIFKSMIADRILESFESEDMILFGVPIGTLTDIGVFYEKGPEINFRLKLYGDVNTTIESRFTSVGINQTKHSIICRVEANISIITPGFILNTPITGEYLIAETVVIGNVPDSYTNVNGDESDIIGKIFDYADIE